MPTKQGPLGKWKISYVKPVFQAGMTGSFERKAEVNYLVGHDQINIL